MQGKFATCVKKWISICNIFLTGSCRNSVIARLSGTYDRYNRFKEGNPVKQSSNSAKIPGINGFPTVITYVKLLCVSYILSALLLLLTAFLLYQMKLGAGPVQAMVYGIYVLSCAIGGFLAGRSSGQRRFFWGLLFGAFYFLILLGTSFAIGKEICQGTGHMLTALGICLAAGCVGGMIS